ncbi:MAG TPA: hypothetical protein VFK59_07985 [Actinomycetota bacterium]|nr:hypothetical protein [Actinomycetota bacterium]
MEQQPVAPDNTNVVPLRVAGEFPPSLEELVEQGFRIALGLVTLSTEALTEAVARTLGGPGPRPEQARAEASSPSAGLPLLAGAAFGVAAGTIRWSARTATTLVRTGELVLSPVTTSAPFRDAMRRLGSGLDSLDSRWREERPREEEAAAAFLRTLVPEVVDAVLDQVDIDEVVAQRVDLDRVVARVDLDEVVARVDIDRVIERVDLSELVERIPLDDVVARIDLDDIVARVDLERVVDRIDVDAVAAKLDVEAVVRRLDLVAIAREVVDELDLPEIIRESMGSMTTETVGGIRVQSMNADRAISRLVDRVLQRRGPGETGPEDQA